MKNKISLIGGDQRIINLAKMLREDGNDISVYGMERSKEIMENTSITKVNSLGKVIDVSDIIIGSIPFSKDDNKMNAIYTEEVIKITDIIEAGKKNKTFIAGSINDKYYELLANKYGKVIDIMKREELVVLNTIATAEGAIEIAIRDTDTIIHGSKVLVLGFGRVGKVVAKKFQGLDAKVTCAARKATDFAWIEILGYDILNINELGENIKTFDIIINTVPKLIINKKIMKYMKKDVLMIDLASAPGGMDREAAKEMNLNLNWALALPGKVAPYSSARFIKNTIYNILEEK